ncbi:unnamed protein product, partial [Amoebophrya sp. A25]
RSVAITLLHLDYLLISSFSFVWYFICRFRLFVASLVSRLGFQRLSLINPFRSPSNTATTHTTLKAQVDALAVAAIDCVIGLLYSSTPSKNLDFEKS